MTPLSLLSGERLFGNPVRTAARPFYSTQSLSRQESSLENFHVNANIPNGLADAVNCGLDRPMPLFVVLIMEDVICSRDFPR